MASSISCASHAKVYSSSQRVCRLQPNTRDSIATPGLIATIHWMHTAIVRVYRIPLRCLHAVDARRVQQYTRSIRQLERAQLKRRAVHDKRSERTMSEFMRNGSTQVPYELRPTVARPESCVAWRCRIVRRATERDQVHDVLHVRLPMRHQAVHFATGGIRYIEGNRKHSPTRLTARRGTRQKSNTCAARAPVARGRLAVWTLKN